MVKKRYAMLIDFRRCIGSHTSSPVPVIKPELGIYPQAYYVDLDADIIGAK